MASSLSNAKIFSTFVFNGFSNAISRRGYAAAGGAGSRGAARNGAVVKQVREEIAGAAEKVVWVPDPVTGCYRPENCVNEIDVAELRTLLLKKK